MPFANRSSISPETAGGSEANVAYRGPSSGPHGGAARATEAATHETASHAARRIRRDP